MEKTFRKKINAVAADEKFNQVVVHRALDKKIKEFLNRLYH